MVQKQRTVFVFFLLISLLLRINSNQPLPLGLALLMRTWAKKQSTDVFYDGRMNDTGALNEALSADTMLNHGS
jgi:hypothetical protein